ncbi:MAG: D-alanine-D-alanine ligase [Actinomycetota bacterium]|jgi:D-alanine-D-alanine ligase|nr:D-alanine-D-alanine ligase [Actinomycetota bacterium]
MCQLSRIRVAVLFGGRSGEHEVSCISARHVAAAFDPDRYQVVPVGITRDGRWLLPEVSRRVLEGGRLHIPETAFEAAGEPVALAEGTRGAAAAGLEVDVVFPVLHGPYGEDGTVQGLLDMAGIPYVGSGVLGSALGMDKEKMKRMFRDHGLPIGDFVAIRAHEWEDDAARCLEAAVALGFPSFAKPANLGSSVGVSKCQDEASLVAGIEEALRHDRKVLVEEGMAGREIEVGVLGNDHPDASVPGEVFPGREFYDYAAKYLDDTSRTEIPADLPPAVVRELQELAVAAFRAVDAAGMARVDFFWDEAGQTGARAVVNEINTIPGFTEISMFPQLWEASGLPYPRLLDRLVELALERHRQRPRPEAVGAPWLEDQAVISGRSDR